MSSGEPAPSKNLVKRKYCRCQVVTEETRAFLKVGRKRYPAILYDRSIGGFSILLKPGDAQKARIGDLWVLQTTTEKSHVIARWMDQCPDGYVHVGLQRIEDLYRSNASGPFPIWLGKRRRSMRPELAIAVIVLLAIGIFSVPAVRDFVVRNDQVQTGLNYLRSNLQSPPNAENLSQSP